MTQPSEAFGASSRDERAGEWAVRTASGPLGPDEQASLEAWLEADTENRHVFERAQTVWRHLDAISEEPEIISQRADALDALRRANQRRWSRAAPGSRPWWLGLAASLALIVSLNLGLLAPRSQDYVTGIGERRTEILPDGSRLSLDADTKVTVAYTRDHRELTLLSGRAKFDVAKDSARPFTVSAADQTVIATGTAFSVELLGKQVHVILYGGEVAILQGNMPQVNQLLRIKAHPGRTSAALMPGQEFIADIDLPKTARIQAADVGQTLSWQGGQLNFVDESLGSAVEQINRYASQPILLGDTKVASIQVNGVFDAGDTETFVEAITRAGLVVESHKDGKIVVTSRTT